MCAWEFKIGEGRAYCGEDGDVGCCEGVGADFWEGRGGGGVECPDVLYEVMTTFISLARLHRISPSLLFAIIMEKDEEEGSKLTFHNKTPYSTFYSCHSPPSSLPHNSQTDSSNLHSMPSILLDKPPHCMPAHHVPLLSLYSCFLEVDRIAIAHQSLGRRERFQRAGRRIGMSNWRM